MVWGAILGAVASGMISKAMNKNEDKYNYNDPRSAKQKALNDDVMDEYSNILGLKGKLSATQKQVLLGQILGQVDLGYKSSLDNISGANFDARTKEALRFQAGRDRAQMLGQSYQGLNEYGLSQYNNSLSGAANASATSPQQVTTGVTQTRDGQIGKILGDNVGSSIAYWAGQQGNKNNAVNYDNEYGAGSGYKQDWGAKFNWGE